jgi:dephospho-CoA kinase
MKLCGLTGGVGMGKSTAAAFFLQQGVPVIDTDDIARRLVEPGQSALGEIQNKFGEKILTPAGALNRAELARLVFADESARKILESILHPRIRESWLAQADQWRKENHPLAIVVIPLLFETQAETNFDRIICVACSSVAQRERLVARGWSPEQIQQRNAAQLPVEQKIARSHFVVWSEGLSEVHRRQIVTIIGKI